MNPRLGRVAARCAARRGGHPQGMSSHCRWGSRERPWSGATRLVSSYNERTTSAPPPVDEQHEDAFPDDRRKDDRPSPLKSYSPSTEGTTTAAPSNTALPNSMGSGFVPSTEWIPPPRSPLLQEEDVEDGDAPLRDGGDASSTSPELTLHNHLNWIDTRDGYGRMVAPAQRKEIRRRGVSDLPVLHHTLLSRDEIGLCLRETGARDIAVIMDDEDQPRMGGAAGMILATASTLHQLRSIADELVGQLRRRKLHEVGVVGAEMGPEGSLRDEEESWFVVDCQNYVVHLMDETTRRCLKLEDLWMGNDGLHRLNILDEDAVDAYVSDHPVPDEYGRGSLDMDETLRMLEKIRWAAVPRPTSAADAAPKKSRKRRGRRG